jgi:deoxyinosine 3'endonuclease (endonuclease V)
MKGNVQISISVGICGLFFYRCVARVGGVDLSIMKGDGSVACAAVVICELPNCEVVYEDITMVQLTVPYVPGR